MYMDSIEIHSFLFFVFCLFVKRKNCIFRCHTNQFALYSHRYNHQHIQELREIIKGKD